MKADVESVICCFLARLVTAFHSTSAAAQDDDRSAQAFQQLDRDDFDTRAEVRECLPNSRDASGAILDRRDRDSNDRLDKPEFARLKNLDSPQ
jgi:hypothetical protein